jgi:hypothetical protein
MEIMGSGEWGVGSGEGGGDEEEKKFMVFNFLFKNLYRRETWDMRRET